MMMMNSVEPTSAWTGFFLLLFFSVLVLVPGSRADAEEFFCCYGWSDERDKMMVIKEEPSNRTSCWARNFCEGAKCAIEFTSWGPNKAFGKERNEEKAAKDDDDCFKWTPASDFDSCYCQKNYCNCPDTLRNEPPKPKPPGLKCWDNQENVDKVKKVTCPDTLPQPLGCTAVRTASAWAVECGLGTRFSDNCSEYVANHPDNPLQGTCYCQKDLCNSPVYPPPPTVKPTTTTPKSFQIQNHVPEFRLIFTTAFFVLLTNMNK